MLKSSPPQPHVPHDRTECLGMVGVLRLRSTRQGSAFVRDLTSVLTDLFTRYSTDETADEQIYKMVVMFYSNPRAGVGMGHGDTKHMAD